MRSPSQWPGTTRVSTSFGRSAMGVTFCNWPRRSLPRARGLRVLCDLRSSLEPGLVGWGGRIRTSVFWIRPFSQIGHQRLFAHELQTSETQRRQLSAGTAPADLTVTGLAKALPYSWAEQESSIGFPAIRVFRARGLHAASGLIALRLRI